MKADRKLGVAIAGGKRSPFACVTVFNLNKRVTLKDAARANENIRSASALIKSRSHLPKLLVVVRPTIGVSNIRYLPNGHKDLVVFTRKATSMQARTQDKIQCQYQQTISRGVCNSIKNMSKVATHTPYQHYLYFIKLQALHHCQRAHSLQQALIVPSFFNIYTPKSAKNTRRAVR